MKTALMSYHYNYQYKITAVKNIGDYIQAIAARQFLSPDIWLDQNELWRYDDEPIKMIMNGWYMHAPEMFPPSEKILPLRVSAHFEPSIIENPKCVDYFKKHEPVGCRDYPTMRVFRRRVSNSLQYITSDDASRGQFITPVAIPLHTRRGESVSFSRSRKSKSNRGMIFLSKSV